MRLKNVCRWNRPLHHLLRIRGIVRREQKRGLLWIMDSFREPAFLLRILTLIIYRLLETHDPLGNVFRSGFVLFSFFAWFSLLKFVSISEKCNLFVFFFGIYACCLTHPVPFFQLVIDDNCYDSSFNDFIYDLY